MSKGIEDATYRAVKEWLKAGIALSDASPQEREMLDAATELVATSVEYIIECRHDIATGRYPTAAGLAAHLGEKSLRIGVLSGSQQLKCVAAMFDTAVGAVQTLRVATATPALMAASGGVGSVFLIYSAIGLACSAMEMHKACKPLLNEFLRDAYRRSLRNDMTMYYLHRFEQQLRMQADGRMIA